MSNQPWRNGFSNAVCSEDHSQQRTQNLKAENLGGDQRNDHVISAEPNAKQHGEGIHRGCTRGKKQKWDSSSHQQVNQEHYVLDGKAIGQPSHQEPSNHAERKHERKDPSRGLLRIMLIEAQEQLEILLSSADRRDGAHAGRDEEIERGSLECRRDSPM